MKTAICVSVCASLLGSVVLLPGCQGLYGTYASDPNWRTKAEPITCEVKRRDLSTVDSDGSRTYHGKLSFSATACQAVSDGSPQAACQRIFCGSTDQRDYASVDCEVTAVTNPSSIKTEAGICTPVGNQGKAAAVYSQRYAKCDDATCEAVDAPQSYDMTSAFECIDVSNSAAVDVLMPPHNAPGLEEIASSIINPSVYLSGYQFGVLHCQEGTYSTESYSIPRSTVGELEETVATAAQPLVASNGNVKIIDTCDPVSGGSDDASGTGETEDPPPGTPVCGLRLDDLKMDLEDITVAGVVVSGVSISNTRRATIATDAAGNNTIPTGGLDLVVTGAVNGSDSLITLSNTVPWNVEISETSVSMAGELGFATIDLVNNPIAVTTSVNFVAPKSNDQEIACAKASRVQKLLGFESRPLWQSSNASLVGIATRKTEGCGALGVLGQGYMRLNSDLFPTSELTLKSAISVDVYVPVNQPNQWWYGDVQMMLTCRSGNVYDQYIGIQPLTGLPKGVFSTRRLPIPAAVMTTLNRGLTDCSLGVVLNVNATGQHWVLDNLRFTP